MSKFRKKSFVGFRNILIDLSRMRSSGVFISLNENFFFRKTKIQYNIITKCFRNKTRPGGVRVFPVMRKIAFLIKVYAYKTVLTSKKTFDPRQFFGGGGGYKNI